VQPGVFLHCTKQSYGELEESPLVRSHPADVEHKNGVLPLALAGMVEEVVEHPVPPPSPCPNNMLPTLKLIVVGGTVPAAQWILSGNTGGGYVGTG
jgi:hypothetical protein